MESNHHSARRQGYNLLSSPLLSVRGKEGGRPDSNRHCEAHDLECLPLHHSHHVRNGDDRTRTGGLSPDKRVLCALSYAPGTGRRVARVGFEPTVSSS